MRQITSDNIVHMEKRATNKFGLFLVFLAVIAIFGGGGFLVYKYRDRIDWDIKLPWETSNKSKGESKKETANKKKNNRELIVPRIISSGFFENKTVFNITEIKADDRGYLFTAELLSQTSWSTITVEAVLIDGFYTSAKFELSDAADVDTQVSTKKTFRIPQTELDNFNINGFTYLNFFYVIEEPYFTSKSKIGVIKFATEYEINNGREGLIKVDQKGDLLIEYYKMFEEDDATYLYFDAKNSDLKSKRKILIKKLMINDRLYEMPEFEVEIFKGARQSFYIKIPKKKIKNVESMLVSFYILNQDENGNNKAIYITNEYSKEF